MNVNVTYSCSALFNESKDSKRFTTVRGGGGGGGGQGGLTGPNGSPYNDIEITRRIHQRVYSPVQIGPEANAQVLWDGSYG